MKSKAITYDEVYDRSTAKRTTELLLLLLAAIPVFLIYALYIANTGTPLTLEVFFMPIVLICLFLAAHIALCFVAPNADQVLLPVVFVLSGIGITFVTRLAPSLAINQVIWLFVGVGLMIITLLVVRNLDRLSKYQYTFAVVGIILILIPMFIGVEQGGSKLWLSLGGISFQPGELAKIAIVLFLASYLAANRELLSVSVTKRGPFKIPKFKMLLPVFVMLALSLSIVVFEHDLGSGLLFYTIFVVMLYVATGRVSYVIISAILLVIGAVACYFLFYHVRVRFDAWLNPFADPQGGGMQMVQSLYSLADGGLFGAGIGRGLPTLIPVVASDFIFSAIGEEMGLLGASAILLLFMIFAIRSFATAARAKSDMAAFTAVGLTTSICFQAFLIVAGVTQFLPLTGVTLPFMSQGGSSLVSSFIIVGLLLRCGDQGTGQTQEIQGTGIFNPYAKNDAEGDDGSSGDENAYAQNAARQKAQKNPETLHLFGLDLGIRNPFKKHRSKHSAPKHSAKEGAKLSFGLKTPESGVLGRVALSKRLIALVTFFTILFAALIGNLTFIQVVKASEYQTMETNNHAIYKASRIQRGSIITSDGVTLAQSVKNAQGTYEREYPQGSMAMHTIGYISSQYGASGLESALNQTLTGNSGYSNWISAINAIAGIPQAGNTVTLTINSKIQRACEQALSSYSGAIVVMDPQSGAVLAKASSPTYSFDELADIMAGNTTKKGVLIDRATQTLYPPGSTYKVVTLSSALDSGKAKLTDVYNAPATLDIGNAAVTNDDKKAYGRISLERALAVSANTVFGQVAVDVGPETLVKYARAFGYGKELGQDFSCKASVMPDPSEMTEWETAWAGCGQPVGEHTSPAGPQTTVMQNALIAQAIANKGVVMNPYLVKLVTSADGQVVSTTQPKSLGQAITSDTAEQVAKAMLEVTSSGTGTATAAAGVKVAGKTGTAETASGVNSLFIGYAPFDNPKLAVSICIEGSKGKDVQGVATVLAGQILSQALSVVH